MKPYEPFSEAMRENPDSMGRALPLTQAMSFPMEELISARNL